MAWPFTTWSCGADTVPRVNKSRTPAKTIVKQLRNVLPPWERMQSLRPEEKSSKQYDTRGGHASGESDVGIKRRAYPVQLGVNGG